MNYPKSLPAAHQKVLAQILDVFSEDLRIEGISASGSYATDSMDIYSDLDLTIAIKPDYYNKVMIERFKLIKKVDGCIAAFTGEHVGEPRLVIALYEPELIHVDFKFVSLLDAAKRVDETIVLWERENKLSKLYKTSVYEYPQPDIQWIEDRFWIWVHYGATKIARGEYFETLEFINFLRTNVLSPLALKQRGLTPSGVRNIEKRLPDLINEFKDTIAVAEKQSLISAFKCCISMYLKFRDVETVNINSKAQRLACSYFEQELEFSPNI